MLRKSPPLPPTTNATMSRLAFQLDFPLAGMEEWTVGGRLQSGSMTEWTAAAAVDVEST